MNAFVGQLVSLKNHLIVGQFIEIYRKFNCATHESSFHFYLEYFTCGIGAVHC
jgi:hypothetical protein